MRYRFIVLAVLVVNLAASHPAAAQHLQPLEPWNPPRLFDGGGDSLDLYLAPTPGSGWDDGVGPSTQRRILPSGWELDLAFRRAPGYSVPSVATGDAQGNTYTVSQETPPDGGLDVVTRKFDPSGMLLWATGYASEGESAERPTAVLATDDAVYVTLEERNAEGRPEVATVRYDAGGALSWVRRYTDPRPTSDDNTRLRGLALGPDGSIVVGGSTDEEESDYDRDMLMIKYTPEGEEVWRVVFGTNGEQDSIQDLATDSQGNVYVVGTGDESSFYTAKFSSDGAFVWGQAAPDIYRSYPYGTSIRVVGDSAVYSYGIRRGVAGTFATTIRLSPEGSTVWEHLLPGISSTTDFEVGTDGHPVVLASLGADGMRLSKITPSGETAWTYDFAGSASDLAIGEDGTSYLTGSMTDASNLVYLTLLSVSAEGSLDWERTVLDEGQRLARGLHVVSGSDGVRVAGTVVEGWYETALWAYDAGGTRQWATSVEGADTSFDSMLDVTAGSAADEALYLTGVTWTPIGYYDVLTVKLDYDGEVIWTRELDAGGVYESGRVIASTSEGVLVAGTTRPSGGEEATLVAAYSLDGEVQWAFTGSHGTPVDLVPGEEGRVFVLSSVPHPTSNRVGYSLIELGAGGELLWEAREFGDVEGLPTAPVNVLAVPTGAVVLSSDLVGQWDTDFLTVWYDHQGEELSRSRFSGNPTTEPRREDMPRRLLPSPQGGVYAVGDSQYGSFPSYTDIVVVYYGAMGEVVWTSHLPLDEDNEYAFGAELDPDGGLVVNGSYFSEYRTDVAVYSVGGDGAMRWAFLPHWTEDRSSGEHSVLQVNTASQALVVSPHQREERWDTVVQTIEDGEESRYERFLGRGDPAPGGWMAPPHIDTDLDPDNNLYIARDVEGYADFLDINVSSVITVRRFAEGGMTPGEEEPAGLPSRVTLSQPFPNPARVTARFHYAVATAGHVRVTAYDVLGREVAVLVDDHVAAGRYEATIDTSTLASGLYVLRLRTKQVSMSTRLVVL